MHTALIVDDHPFIRASVKLLLAQENVAVVAETDNGVDAIQLARELSPDLIVLDISMPALDGLEVINRIGALGLPLKVLVLTSQAPAYFARRCMNAGAAGYVCKTNGLDEVKKAVVAIMSGYLYFPSVVASSVKRSDVYASESERIAQLSDRELTILQQLARGLSNKEIGDAMLLSNKTVSTYKARVIEKLKVKSVVDLADLARRNELI